MAEMQNKGQAKGNIDTPDVKLTYVPPGYQKQVHDGLAEKAGDQSRIETEGKEPKGGVVFTEAPKRK